MGTWEYKAKIVKVACKEQVESEERRRVARDVVGI